MGQSLRHEESPPVRITPSGGNARTVFRHELDEHKRCTKAPLFDLLGAHRYEENPQLEGVFALPADDPRRARVLRQVRGAEPWSSPAEGRAVGCMLGMSLGDALGSPVEFRPYTPDGCGLVQDMGEGVQGAFDLLPGQYTDDTSMGLCLADSLLMNKGAFVPTDLMLRFVAWWNFGYCNGLQGRHSVGLGGNIKQSFDMFYRTRTPFTSAGDLNTSGNGSVMRNAAIPITFHDDLEKAMATARLQSKTTHQGDEAAEACRLLTFICVRAIHGDGTKRSALADLSAFVSTDEALMAMAASRAQRTAAGAVDPERNWNWHNPNFRYAPQRARKQPGYVGSYSLDAVAMALHCVWHTDSARAAMLLSANKCGDADSVTSVTGQLAGAIYGVGGERGVPVEWYDVQQQWDRGGDIAVRAARLFAKDFDGLD